MKAVGLLDDSARVYTGHTDVIRCYGEQCGNRTAIVRQSYGNGTGEDAKRLLWERNLAEWNNNCIFAQ